MFMDFHACDAALRIRLRGNDSGVEDSSLILTILDRLVPSVMTSSTSSPASCR
jgi:hypothetical protein